MMQNTSTAVMASNHTPPDDLSYFPTPPWATRALCDVVIPHMPMFDVWEPACGEGHMAQALKGYFHTVIASDIFDYGYGEIADFLLLDAVDRNFVADWIITNPPFNKAAEFTLKALQLARFGVAMLARVSWFEGVARERELFGPHPLTLYCPFTERVPMFKGKLDRAGSTATAYAWFVWIKGAQPNRIVRIPAGTKARLDRDEDWRTPGINNPLPPLLSAI